MDKSKHILEHIQGKYWYPSECCNYEVHCRPVPCDQIVDNGKEYVYQGLHFTGEMVRATQDQFCHVCMSNWENLSGPLCLFIKALF